MYKTIILILFIVLTFLSSGCLGSDSVYRIVKIAGAKGDVFYFRRETWGLNHDTLSLTTNSYYCSKPNPAKDIIFRGLGPINLFYRLNGEELHIYLITTVEVPLDFSKNTVIVQHKLSNPEFMALSENYKSNGLQYLEVPLDNKLTCNDTQDAMRNSGSWY